MGNSGIPGKVYLDSKAPVKYGWQAASFPISQRSLKSHMLRKCSQED